MNAVIQHAHAQKQSAGNETVGHHLHHGAFHPQGCALDTAGLAENGKRDEHPQGHEAHVRDGGIGNQLFHVLLGQGHEADVHHRDQRQGNDEPVQCIAGIRGDGQREPHKTVTADLEHDGGQDYRAAGGRFHVGIRQPGVHRPHGNFHRKGGQQAQEQPGLGGEAQGQLVPVENGETAGLYVEPDEAHQHEHRTQKGVEEKLDGGVDPARTTPDADHQEHGDQHGFEEHVEQDAVQGAEHPDHQPFQQQERRHVLVHPVLHPPAGDDHQHAKKGGEQHQRQGQTIHRHVVVDVESLDPELSLLELHGRGCGIKALIQWNAQRQCHRCRYQRDHFRQLGPVAAGQQHQHCADDGGPDEQAQQGPLGQHDKSLLQFLLIITVFTAAAPTRPPAPARR